MTAWKAPLRRLLDQGAVTPKQAAAALGTDIVLAQRRLHDFWVNSDGSIRRDFDRERGEYVYEKKEDV